MLVNPIELKSWCRLGCPSSPQYFSRVFVKIDVFSKTDRQYIKVAFAALGKLEPKYREAIAADDGDDKYVAVMSELVNRYGPYMMLFVLKRNLRIWCMAKCHTIENRAGLIYMIFPFSYNLTFTNRDVFQKMENHCFSLAVNQRSSLYKFIVGEFTMEGYIPFMREFILKNGADLLFLAGNNAIIFWVMLKFPMTIKSFLFPHSYMVPEVWTKRDTLIPKIVADAKTPDELWIMPGDNMFHGFIKTDTGYEHIGNTDQALNDSTIDVTKIVTAEWYFLRRYF